MDDVTGDVDISGLEPEDATLSDLTADDSLDDLGTETDLALGGDDSTATDTLEADLLAEEGDVESELVDSIDGDLEADLSGLETDDLEEEELDATGDIDAAQLNQDLEIEEEDWSDEDEEEEENLSGKDKILKVISEKIPALGNLLNKKKVNADEDDDTVTRTEIDSSGVTGNKIKAKPSLADKVPALKGLLSKLGKKKDLEDDDEDFDPDEVSPIKYADDEEAPKKKLKVIHIVIIGIAVVGLFYEDIFPPETPPPKPKLKKMVKGKPIPKNKPAAPVEAPAAKTAPAAPVQGDRTAEQIKEVGTTSKDELASDTDLPVDTSPTDNQGNEETTEDAPTQDNVAQTPPAVEDDSMDEIFDESENDAALEVPNNAPTTAENESENESEGEPENIDVETSQEDGDVDAFEDNVGDTAVVSGTGQVEPGLTLTDGQIGDEVIDGAGNQDITKSILQDLEVKIQSDKKKNKIIGDIKPTDPPTYEINGRGLTYNCAGKHWACVDSVSFKTCEKNYAWNSSQGKAVECYPVKLFNKVENCEQTQQKKIDNVAETNFCSF